MGPAGIGEGRFCCGLLVERAGMRRVIPDEVEA